MFLFTKEGRTILVNLACFHHKGFSGCKNRSTQLYELFTENGWDPEPVEVASPKPIDTLLSGLKLWSRYGTMKPICKASLQSAGHRYFRYNALLEKYPAIDTVVLEGTGFNVLNIIPFLKAKGKKVILIPANVESLAPYTNAWTHQKSIEKRFLNELPWYKKADHVYTISMEEQWLLSVMGVRAEFLSYYPGQALRAVLDKRREVRSPDGSLGWLYVANFNNEPNVKGLKDLMTQVQSGSILLDKKLVIVGMGCENIEALIPLNSNIEVRGFVNDETLEDYYKRCDAVYLHHFPTSGMLTRVIEYLYSGIPIQGNLAALKSYYHFLGEKDVQTKLLEHCKKEVTKFFLNL